MKNLKKKRTEPGDNKRIHSGIFCNFPKLFHSEILQRSSQFSTKVWGKNSTVKYHPTELHNGYRKRKIVCDRIEPVTQYSFLYWTTMMQPLARKKNEPKWATVASQLTFQTLEWHCLHSFPPHCYKSTKNNDVLWPPLLSLQQHFAFAIN